MKKLLLLALIPIMSHAYSLGDYSKGHAYAAKISVMPHRIIHICSKHEVHLVNNQPYMTTVNYQFNLCLDFNECTFKFFTQHLKPMEVFEYQDEVCQDVEFAKSGNYAMIARTRILDNPSVDIKHVSAITVY